MSVKFFTHNNIKAAVAYLDELAEKKRIISHLPIISQRHFFQMLGIFCERDTKQYLLWALYLFLINKI